jgi:hypothetical protein
MALVTIPFNYEELPDKSGIVPICLDDTDRHGRKIGWGWITAIPPIADLLRRLARRRLDDVHRVSELTELSVHDVWYAHGEDYGNFPQWLIYRHAKWKAEDLRYGSWRIRRGREVGLGELEAALRARGDHAKEFEHREIVEILRQEFSNTGQDDVAEMLEQVLHGCTWDEVTMHLGKEPTKKNVNTIHRRFWRAVERAARFL